jgi:hypothetical protein
MLRRRWPAVDVHQIDARPDVVAEAARQDPGVKVEQMLASNMATIADGSKQLVVAMSVFDQNADDLLPAIAAEVHRVLARDGLVVYVHNEELNLPSAADSLLQRTSDQSLLLPNDRWLHANDLEYCSANRRDVERALSELGDDAAPLAKYMLDLYPRLYGRLQTRSVNWKVAAPAMRDYTLPMMDRVRRSVAMLRERHGVRFDDHCTMQLLQEHVEDRTFCVKHGFRVVRSGCFELRHAVGWQKNFQARPSASHFVRGTMRFGYATTFPPPPVDEYVQDLNGSPEIHGDEVELIAYQYGMVAHRV